MVPAIHKVLRTAIKRHLLADVPVGVFLSGGIDSSLVAAIASDEYRARLKTFTARFSNEKCDESEQASRIAHRVGSEHYEIEITDELVLDAFDRIHDIWGEPFADPAQIPAVVLANYARNEVSVVLTGDGGDEYFGGYRKYRIASQLIKFRDRKGGYLLSKAAKAGLSILERVPIPNSCSHLKAIGMQLRGLLDCNTIGELAVAFDSRYSGQLPFVSASQEDRKGYYEHMDLTAINQYDILKYLPEDLMVKSDRSGMAFGLELRSPFLDADLIKCASELPFRAHIGKQGKSITREIAKSYFPESVYGRSKTGFGVPMIRWIRGPLMPKLEAVRHCLDDSAYPIEKDWVRRILADWDRGHTHQSRLVWNLLVFTHWFMRNKQQ
jgi:asparagine synthase (glutamine-hydrolysing)